MDEDYVYRDGALLAAETSAGVRHFHLDHLGTPRLITNGSGLRVAYHVYYPFGEEATDSFQNFERMKFTGHERDFGDPSGTADDLDYMHARHCSPLINRFLSTDPADSSEPTSPQTLNRYSYVVNNPIKFTDPTGEVLRLGQGSQQDALDAARLMVEPAARQAINLGTDANGHAIITIDNTNKSTDANFKTLQKVVNSPGVVEFNQVSATTSITARTGPGHSDPGQVETFSLQGVRQKGVTLPSLGTTRGDEAIFSDQTGVTRIFVEQTPSPQGLAPRLASELAGHALPALLGLGAKARNQEEHALRELPARRLAKRNAAIQIP